MSASSQSKPDPIRWENVPETEIRADAEAALEMSGKTKEIRQFLSQNRAIEDWRKEIRELCRNMINEIGIDNVNPDMLYDLLAAQGHDQLPAEVVTEVTTRIKTFLNTQFEEHP
ncbi:hypothetical protein TVAG_230760 [Trichomonas vaginalis G3]|uniref:Transcription and mRNA export factor ENY2 n=1 Tax=Trichomonas vaginalis (strain ATCC PRA-98 / G3) TaxID=412133 RepID=A2EE04_TRIV3|nr:transcription factor e(y)2 family [Trichomonas vaginalis G3]EAY09116.1 hypothetical protein TVAG_230760 [Trichomonas vaginalis G3]KAI5502652.1 transcription factor e(y)2 family [Trichomonas vaginalis G3]|eukprot:XP_001321339.1 hypothetical protein [Trichomonas vaginalis G3]